eukprot:CAMPEP_0170195300 /NCGR_PEP_ID=MMETSP0040_2-20121228/61219_1 /TAXON_ID=641309 /ORGANISM="Lotharella oceanica, Strain CCMP622" /LENGTH=75 /DNA_ID=CAMNT_0010444431 /DNA_START=39 /DNA_END=262 /DNA_ORIENTATION=-
MTYKVPRHPNPDKTTLMARGDGGQKDAEEEDNDGGTSSRIDNAGITHTDVRRTTTPVIHLGTVMGVSSTGFASPA